MRTALVIVALACGALLVFLRSDDPASIKPATSPTSGASAPAPTATDLEAAPDLTLDAEPLREAAERVGAPSPAEAYEEEDAASKPEPPTGSVHVHVVDDLGRPVTMGSVVLQRLGRDWHAAAVDDRGWARFESVAIGRFELEVQLLPPELHAPAEGQKVLVEEGRVAEARAECPRAGRLRVWVGGVDGTASQEALVRLDELQPGPTPRPVTTNGVGLAEFEGLHPGRYSVVVRLAPGTESALMQPPPTTVEILPGQTHETKLTLERTGLEVRVLVRDRLARGVERIPVAIYNHEEGTGSIEELARQWTDERGFASFVDCPRAQLRVVVPMNPMAERPWGTEGLALPRKVPAAWLVDLRGATSSPARHVFEVDLEPSTRRLRLEVDESNMPREWKGSIVWSRIRVTPGVEVAGVEGGTPLLLSRARDGAFHLTVRDTVTSLTLSNNGGGGGPGGVSYSLSFSETLDISHLPADGRTLSTLRITPPAPKIVERDASSR